MENYADLEDANYRDGDLSRRCNSSLVVAWLRDHYRFGKSGSISKNSVYVHYLGVCSQRGLETDINQTFFGKLVKKAFPGIQYNRKGPRGRSEHHYKHLKRAKHAHSADPRVIGAAGIPPSQDLPRIPEQPRLPCCYPQQHLHQHQQQRFPTNLGPLLGSRSVVLSGEPDAIGRTSSRSPSPPSSPPSSLHPNYYYSHHYHSHLPQRPPQPYASDHHHPQNSQCPCPVSDHPRPERTTVSSSPRSFSPIPLGRPYPAPYAGWNAAGTGQYPLHHQQQQQQQQQQQWQQQQPLHQSRMPFGLPRQDLRQPTTMATTTTGEASWSEWSFSKMVEPVAQPLVHPHHRYPGEWEETAHHHHHHSARPLSPPPAN